MLKELHKELALYRASWYVGRPGAYTPRVFLDPVERVEMAEQSQEAAQLRADVEEDLFGPLGWS